ncbi:MAG: cytochrome c biogenesis protein/redoxin [Candidatus Alcyoniella australis]|nr:cytochrome c biogenesis protein/redoxin [Candidatus Alcyoniella australis]
MQSVIDYFLDLQHISSLGVFTVGILSFFTPCVLPLVFSYLTFISGVSFDELTAERRSGGTLGKVLLNTVLFILGFSVVFLIVGGLAGALGELIRQYQAAIYIIAAALVVVLALHIMGAFKLKFLMTEHRIQVQNKVLGPIGSFIVGFTFAFALSPCLSGIVIAIIPLAVTEESFIGGLTTMAIFSAGLGMPFLLTALFVNQAMKFFGKMRTHYRAVEIVSGLILILLAAYLALTGIKAMGQIEFQDLEGKRVVQSDYRGDPLLMVFFASYCAPCINEVPELNRLHAEYGPQGLQVVGVNYNEDASIAEGFREEHGVGYPVLLSGEEGLPAMGGSSLPFLVLIDERGRTVGTASRAEERKKLIEQIPDLL